MAAAVDVVLVCVGWIWNGGAAASQHLKQKQESAKGRFVLAVGDECCPTRTQQRRHARGSQAAWLLAVWARDRCRRRPWC